jgi:CBS domain-containing protein
MSGAADREAPVRGAHMRTIREIMTPNVRTIPANTLVSEVAGIFELEKIGGAPLVDEDGNIVGLVSKSDIVHFEFVGGDPYEARVWEIASPHLLTIDVSSPLVDAARKMLEEHVHRLMVVDGEEPVGMLTSLNFVSLALDADESNGN